METVTAYDLIDILKATAHNMGVSLGELKVAIADTEGYAHWIDSYETIDPEAGNIIILNAK